MAENCETKFIKINFFLLLYENALGLSMSGQHRALKLLFARNQVLNVCVLDINDIHLFLGEKYELINTYLIVIRRDFLSFNS